jgi:hypothetical protein
MTKAVLLVLVESELTPPPLDIGAEYGAGKDASAAAACGAEGAEDVTSRVSDPRPSSISFDM